MQERVGDVDLDVYPALFSLNMLLGTAAGRSYAEGELRGMLGEAGITDVRRLPMPPGVPSAILAGVKSRQTEALKPYPAPRTCPA